MNMISPLIRIITLMMIPMLDKQVVLGLLVYIFLHIQEMQKP